MDESRRANPLLNRIWEILATIDDPEMPISIVDLGIVERVEVDAAEARIVITPTYTGCPALQMIDEQIVKNVKTLPEVDGVHVEHVFEPAWSAARISEAGRQRLKRHGVTVSSPQLVQVNIEGKTVVNCPYCDSLDTRLDSPFGPTRCRAIYYCSACRNSFEHIKAAQ